MCLGRVGVVGASGAVTRGGLTAAALRIPSAGLLGGRAAVSPRGAVCAEAGLSFQDARR